MHRKPAVSGQFYPGNESTLKKDVDGFLKIDVTSRRALGVIAPHAGYVYSGAIAGEAFASVDVPRRCIILSPNHTGMGSSASLMSCGSWEIPTGTIPVDEDLASKILDTTSALKDDAAAHLAEHSLEVELPFMLARQPELSIVPITIAHISPTTCWEIGEALASVIAESDDDILIVASTDMNHYESQTITLEKDRLAIKYVESMDEEGLLKICGEQRISMCGVVPTAIALHACKKLGATRTKLIRHATSGDISGDYNAVVGYASFIIE
jgi:MEMO1 family protein